MNAFEKAKLKPWMKEWSDAEDKARLLRDMGFNAEVRKVCNHFVVDMKGENLHKR